MTATVLAANSVGAGQQAAPAPQPPAARKGRIKQGVTRGVFARGHEPRGLLPRSRAARHQGLRPDRSRRLADAQEIRPRAVDVSGRPGGTIPGAEPQGESRAPRPRCAPASTRPRPTASRTSSRSPATATAWPTRRARTTASRFSTRSRRRPRTKSVTICMEYLNSKVNHKDYMFDHIAWGVDVMKRVNSPRVKILFDIYHAQIMDGDIVRNIRDNFQWIGHFHTGGNPGRHDIDETQELNYRFIMQAIADLGFTGFVSHEYSPAGARSDRDAEEGDRDLRRVTHCLVMLIAIALARLSPLALARRLRASSAAGALRRSTSESRKHFLQFVRGRAGPVLIQLERLGVLDRLALSVRRRAAPAGRDTDSRRRRCAASRCRAETPCGRLRRPARCGRSAPARSRRRRTAMAAPKCSPISSAPTSSIPTARIGSNG